MMLLMGEAQRGDPTAHVAAQVAQAQADTLVRTLDALATDARLEAFLPNLLRAIAQQLRAQGAGVWISSDDGTKLLPAYYCEEGIVLPASDSDHPAMRRTWDLNQQHPEVQRMTATREPMTYTVARDEIMRPEVREYLQAKGIRAALTIPIFVRDRLVGILSARRDTSECFNQDDLRIGQALAHQASLAIELTRLAEQSRRAAVTEERMRLAREIHDSLGQALTAAIAQIEAARRAPAQAAAVHLEHAMGAARAGLAEVRRSVRWMRTDNDIPVDLVASMGELVARHQLWSNATVATRFAEAECVVPSKYADALLRVAQEALMNTVRHAPASPVEVRLACDAGMPIVEVRDLGPGFDVDAHTNGFGLAIMRERIDEVGGTLHIASAPGRGTTVTASVPAGRRKLPGDVIA
jgi:signal transduction histidine kinase